MAWQRWLRAGGVPDGDAALATSAVGSDAPGARRGRAVQAHVRAVPRHGRGPRAQPRAVPVDVAGPRAVGHGNRLDGDDGQQPDRRRAAGHRRVPDRPDLRQRAQHDAGAAARCAPRPRRPSTPAPTPPGTAGATARRTPGSRRPTRRACRPADVPKLKLKWAFAFPGDLQSYCAGHGRRRTAVRRQLGRQGLLAERRHRLHRTGTTTPAPACAPR